MEMLAPPCRYSVLKTSELSMQMLIYIHIFYKLLDWSSLPQLKTGNTSVESCNSTLQQLLNILPHMDLANSHMDYLVCHEAPLYPFPTFSSQQYVCNLLKIVHPAHY